MYNLWFKNVYVCLRQIGYTNSSHPVSTLPLAISETSFHTSVERIDK